MTHRTGCFVEKGNKRIGVNWRRTQVFDNVCVCVCVCVCVEVDDARVGLYNDNADLMEGEISDEKCRIEVFFKKQVVGSRE